MSRVWSRLAGSGAGGAFIANDPFNVTRANLTREDLDLLALASFRRNVFAGGSETEGIDAGATGDVDLLHFLPMEVDNTSGQLSTFSDANGGVLVARFRFLVRVSNAAISVTPKIRYGSTFSAMTTVATISGAAACSVTSSDYSGSNQYQTVDVTLPTGVKLFKPQLTIAGTVAAGYQVWGRAMFDLFVQT